MNAPVEEVFRGNRRGDRRVDLETAEMIDLMDDMMMVSGDFEIKQERRNPQDRRKSKVKRDFTFKR